MFAFMTLLPLVILLGSFAIYFKKYNINEERYDEICAEIARRKLAAEGNAEVVLDARTQRTRKRFSIFRCGNTG